MTSPLPTLSRSGARDNMIRVWDMDMDLLCRRTLGGHRDDVLSLAVVSVGKRYHTASDGDLMAARYSQVGFVTGRERQ